MTKRELITAISVLELQYQQMEVSSNPISLNTWATIFAEVPANVFTAACMEHIKESVYAPKPADIMQIINSAGEQLKHLPVDAAWNQLCKLARCMYDKELEKRKRKRWKENHPALYNAARSYTPEQMAMMEYDQETYMFAQFRDIYKEHCNAIDRQGEYLAVTEAKEQAIEHKRQRQGVSVTDMVKALTERINNDD